MLFYAHSHKKHILVYIYILILFILFTSIALAKLKNCEHVNKKASTIYILFLCISDTKCNTSSLLLEEAANHWPEF